MPTMRGSLCLLEESLGVQVVGVDQRREEHPDEALEPAAGDLARRRRRQERREHRRTARVADLDRRLVEAGLVPSTLAGIGQTVVELGSVGKPGMVAGDGELKSKLEQPAVQATLRVDCAGGAVVRTSAPT